MSEWKKKWSSDMLLNFALKYEQFPALWDCNREDYKNREVKEQNYQALKEALSDQFPGIDLTTIKAKIRSFRNAYTLEIHKIIKSSKNGTEELYKPIVPWFAIADRFLKRVVAPRPTQSNLTSKTQAVTDEEEVDSVIECEEATLADIYGTPTTDVERSKKRTSERLQSKFHQRSKKKRNQLSRLIEPVKNVKEHHGSSGDFYDTFGKTVAGYLRQLPQGIALECQGKILNLLIQKCMAHQNFSECPSAGSSYSETQNTSFTNSQYPPGSSSCSSSPIPSPASSPSPTNHVLTPKSTDI